MAMGKEIAMGGDGVRENFPYNGIEIGRHAGRVAWRWGGAKKNPSDGKRGSFNARGAGGNAAQLGGY